MGTKYDFKVVFPLHYKHHKTIHEQILLKYIFSQLLTKYFPSGETLQSWLDCLKTSEKFILKSVPTQEIFTVIMTLFFKRTPESLQIFKCMRSAVFD